VVRPDDDDGPEVGGGPPPDPSLRSWRHPSEIAAAAAAAERPPTPERRISPFLERAAVIGSIALVATTTALAVGTVIALRADTTADRGVTGQAALVPPSPTTTWSSTYDRSDPAGEEVRAAPETEDEDAGGTVESDREESSATVPTGPDESASAEEPDDGTATGSATPWYDDTDALADAYEGDGVYGEASDGIERLASFLVVDDTVVTSSSALAGSHEVVLVAGGTTHPATVMGADDLTDVAVLALGPGDEPLDAETVTFEPIDQPEVESGAELSIVLPPEVAGEEPPADGMAIGEVKRTAAGSGAPIYDLLLTTIQRPEGASGAAVIDAYGQPVGMVADTPSHLTRVVPFEVVVQVAWSYLLSGEPSEEWLGIEGVSVSPSGAEIQTIASDSPAELADLRAGDVITRVDGEAVSDWHHLVYLVRRAGVGTEIRIDVERGDVVASVNAAIGSRIDTDG
jgi:S1-C subfamily serine protease